MNSEMSDLVFFQGEGSVLYSGFDGYVYLPVFYIMNLTRDNQRKKSRPKPFYSVTVLSSWSKHMNMEKINGCLKKMIDISTMPSPLTLNTI